MVKNIALMLAFVAGAEAVQHRFVWMIVYLLFAFMMVHLKEP